MPWPYTPLLDMLEICRILDQLSRAFNGDSWSGPSLLTTLNGVTAAEAAARPLPAAHSIWEIVLHLRFSSELIVRRMSENRALTYDESEGWPAQPALPTEERWQAALQELNAAHVQLLATTAGLPDTMLDRPIGLRYDQTGEVASPSTETGVTFYVTLHGTVQHYLYHAGQIALLRKASQAPISSLETA